MSSQVREGYVATPAQADDLPTVTCGECHGTQVYSGQHNCLANLQRLHKGHATFNIHQQHKLRVVSYHVGPQHQVVYKPVEASEAVLLGC